MLKQITLKMTTGSFKTYELVDAIKLYRDYCKKYISLNVFCSDNFLSTESAEILIKTMRKHIK